MRLSIWSNNHEAPTLKDHQERAENDFLAACIRHDDTGEIHKHHEKIAQIEQEERCLRRAVWLMAALASLASVAAGHSFLLLTDLSPADLRVIIHIFSVVAVASLISLLAFAGVWLMRRSQLGEQRDCTRRLALKLLAARLGVDTTRQAGSRALLLIEDEENDVFFLRRAFSRLGATLNIHVVNNGNEAQLYLRGDGKYADRRSHPSPVVIVCDFKMPQCNGIEFLTWFKGEEQFRHIPFVSLSGTPLPKEVQFARASGATLCLEKDGDFAKVLENAKAIMAAVPGPKT